MVSDGASQSPGARRAQGPSGSPARAWPAHAGLPHILMRYDTTPSVKQARDSVGWSLFFIFLRYFSAQTFAAFAKWTVLTDVIGKADKNDGLLAGLARLALRPARRRHELLPALRRVRVARRRFC